MRKQLYNNIRHVIAALLAKLDFVEMYRRKSFDRMLMKRFFTINKLFFTNAAGIDMEHIIHKKIDMERQLRLEINRFINFSVNGFCCLQ